VGRFLEGFRGRCFSDIAFVDENGAKVEKDEMRAKTAQQYLSKSHDFYRIFEE
jgi:hypothetical protein